MYSVTNILPYTESESDYRSDRCLKKVLDYRSDRCLKKVLITHHFVFFHIHMPPLVVLIMRHRKCSLRLAYTLSHH